MAELGREDLRMTEVLQFDWLTSQTPLFSNTENSRHFRFAFSLGTLYFDQVCFPFRTLTVVFFIRSVLLLVFNLCIGTQLFRVESTEQQLLVLCWKKLDQFRWATKMWSPPVCSRSVTTLVLSLFPSQIGIILRRWYCVSVSSFHKTQVSFPLRKDMFLKGNRYHRSKVKNRVGIILCRRRDTQILDCSYLKA